jgi:hypothetical protein
MVTPPLFCCACKLQAAVTRSNRQSGRLDFHIYIYIYISFSSHGAPSGAHPSVAGKKSCFQEKAACLPASGSHAPNRWSSSKWPSLSLYLSLASAGYDDPFPARVNRTVPSSTRNF